MEKMKADHQPPIEIPMEALSVETLHSVIESFVLREGTDYGRQEIELESKINQIKKQIQAGKVRIAFDPVSESVTLLTENDWKKLTS